MGPRNFTRTIKIDTQIYFILLNFVFTTPHLDMKKIVVIVFTLFIIGIFGQEYPSLQRWNELALSVPRSNIAAASAKNYAILSGGLYENGTASDVVDVLDVSTRNISRLTLPSPRYNILATAAGKYIVFAGGFEVEVNETEANVWSKAIDILDVDAMLWKTSTEFPDSFYATNYTVVTSTENLVVFCNGTSLAIFDPAASEENAWILSEPFTSIPSKANAIAYLGSTIYVSTNRLSKMFLFNDVTDPSQFQNVELAFESMNDVVESAFVKDQSIYFLVEYGRLFQYDTQRDRWEAFLLPTPTSSGAFSIQDIIIAYDAGALYLFVEQYWYIQSYELLNSAAVAVVNDKYVVFAGGSDGENVTAALHVLEYKPAPPTPVTTSGPLGQITSATTFCGVSSFGLILSTIVLALIM
jgi:hypothetical protein